jgi:cyclomaltodextrinase
MSRMKKLELGVYQHYKGKKYLVLGLAKHSETLEEFVTYVNLYENSAGNLWVRPLKMFLENVLVDGKEVPRFKKI